MLIRLALPLIGLLSFAPLANSQTAPANKPGVETTKDGKPKAGAVRKACREEGRGKGLKGKELRASVDECFAKQRPDLAKAAVCRKEGKAKGLEGKALRDHVKTCRAA
jgi:hypothetical protein